MAVGGPLGSSLTDRLDASGLDWARRSGPLSQK
jgi:hypothetical protein